MRLKRFKIIGETALYHCTTETVGQALLFTDDDLRIMEGMLKRQAYFCGVELYTYALMHNHLHVLVRVPEEVVCNDKELINRVQALYKNDPSERAEIVSVLKRKENDNAKCKLRAKLLDRMGDLSVFMKEFKQRVSIYYNHQYEVQNHRRRGTIWASRFTSTVVGSNVETIQTVAAYIDLNPFRAGLVQDSKDYPFCGYHHAVCGDRQAQVGIMQVMSNKNKTEAMAQYRKALFMTGAKPKKAKRIAYTEEEVQAELRREGKIPKHVLLQCRVRYMTDGVVFGSKQFVEQMIDKAVVQGVIKKRRNPHMITECNEWKNMAVLNPLRGLKILKG